MNMDNGHKWNSSIVSSLMVMGNFFGNKKWKSEILPGNSLMMSPIRYSLLVIFQGKNSQGFFLGILILYGSFFIGSRIKKVPPAKKPLNLKNLN